MNKIRRFFLRLIPAVLICAAFLTVRGDRSIAANYGWAADFQRFTGENGEVYYKSVNYKVKLYDGLGGFTYHDISGGTEVRRFELVHETTGERKVAYCIAPGLAYTWLNIYQTDMDGDEAFRAYYNALSQTARDGIAYALMFGYKGDGVCDIEGANAGDYWMATQAIIWEYQQEIRTDALSRHNSGLVGADVFYNIVRDKPAEICYEYILSQIESYSSLLSFCTSDSSGTENVITLNETFPGSSMYEAVLYNTNAGADREFYAVNEAGERISYLYVIKSGSTYSIKSTQAITSAETVKLVATDTYQKENEAFFFTGGENEQPLVSAGTIEDPMCQYLTVKTEASELQNITFKIQKSEENGHVAGVTFLLQWTSNGSVIHKTVTTDETGLATAYLPTGTSQNAMTLRSVFVVELGDSGYSATAKVTGSCILMDSGYYYLTSDNTYSYKTSYSEALALGSGTVHRGWQLYITNTSTSSQIVLNVTNTPDSGVLKLGKTSETPTDETFTFRIEGIDNINSHYCEEKTLTCPSETEISLVVGRYKISEILPEGSSWTQQAPQYVTVEKDETVTVNFTNTRKKGGVIIRKRSEDGDFSGVSFVLSSSDGTYCKTLCAEDGEGVSEDSEGSFLELYESGLSEGTYTVTENCPGKYVAPDSVTVEISAGDIRTVNFVNVLKKGNAMLVKKDYETNEPVSGAFYTLYSSDGTVVSERLETDENGIIRVNGLVLGDYYFLEAEAPSGYTVNNSKTVFSVNEQNYENLQTFNVTDRKISGSVTVTKSIVKSDVVMAHGRPVFAFDVWGNLYDGTVKCYCLYVEFTQTDMAASGDRLEKTVTLEGLPAGTYTVSEKQTNRYETQSVSVLSGSASVAEGQIIWTLTENDSSLSVKFSNRKSDNSGLSHTDLTVNKIGGAS